MQEELKTGELSVERTGTCAGYTYTIEFIGIGGNKDQIEVNGSQLEGDNVTVKAKTLTHGGLFMGPAPMEFFRVPETKPQVGSL